VVSADNGMTHLKLISISHIHCRLCIHIHYFQGYRMSFIFRNFVLWLSDRVIALQFKLITNQTQQFFSLLSWRLFTAQHVSDVVPPIIRSSMTAVAASGFTLVSWWQSCCVRGRAGRPCTTIEQRGVARFCRQKIWMQQRISTKKCCPYGQHYFVDILCFNFFAYKKRTKPRCSFVVHVFRGAAIF
jgi:hypothetical protein